MSPSDAVDTVIDDDEEYCPLCIEEFDLSDKNFKPCPCGYQICQFCYNNIKTHSEDPRCPNCRRVYEEANIEYKVPDVDEYKADLALKHRKATAAKKREAEKHEVEASSRKNLAGVRVVQKNLVYVIGLNPTARDENQLLQTLRGDKYFGQYGEIDKIVVSKAKPGGNPNQGIGVYVTFTRKEDAATCIACVDGSSNGTRILRAQYGTTKYCSSFLRNEQCGNRNCTFLHETGEESETYNRHNMHRSHPALSIHSSQSPYTHHASHRPSHHVSPAIAANPRPTDNSPQADAPALPSSASWANKDLLKSRRPSISGSRPSPGNSPHIGGAVVTPTNKSAAELRRENPTPAEEYARRNIAPENANKTTDAPSYPQPPPRTKPPPVTKERNFFGELLKAVSSPGFKFVFSPEGLSPEEMACVDNHACFIDKYGGIKRRLARERKQEQLKQEAAEARQANLVAPHASILEEEALKPGSSQLGGEPDDHLVGRNVREMRNAIQARMQQTNGVATPVGTGPSPASAVPASPDSQAYFANQGGQNGVFQSFLHNAIQARIQQGVNPTTPVSTAGRQFYGNQNQNQVDEEFPPLGRPPTSKMSSNMLASNDSNRRRSALMAGASPAVGSPFQSNVLDDLRYSPHSSIGPSRATTPKAPPGLNPKPGISPRFRAPPGLRIPPSAAGSVAHSVNSAGVPSVPPSTVPSRSHTPIGRTSMSNTPLVGTPELPSRSVRTTSQSTPLSSASRVETPASAAQAENVRRGPTVPPPTPPVKLELPFQKKPAKNRDKSARSAETEVTQESDKKLETASTPTPISTKSDTPVPPTKHRVLRVVDTSKSGGSNNNNTASLAAASTAPPPPASQLTSDTRSDYAASQTTSTSRTNSPPPTRIGSAPMRMTSKNQAKKERKAKMRQEEAKTAEAVAQLAEETVQAPITSRKRKLKKNITTPTTPAPKTPSTSSAPEAPKKSEVVHTEKGSEDKEGKEQEQEKKKERETPESNDSSNVSGKDKEEEQAQTPVEPPPRLSTVRRHEESTTLFPQPVPTPTPTPEPEKRGVSWHENNTFEQLIHDFEESGIRVKDLFLERTASLPTLLAQLHNSGALNLNTHSLFNSPNLALRTDMKCNAADHDILKHPLHLTSANKRDLANGVPLRLNSESESLKDRCLITPLGAVLRHLSAAEEDRYLKIERRINEEDIDVWQDLPGSSGTYSGSSSASSTGEPDFSNFKGGLEALFSNPEKFNIEWVDTEEEEEEEEEQEVEETIGHDDNVSVDGEQPSPDDTMSLTTYQPSVSPFRATFDFLSSAVLPGLSAPLTDFARSFTNQNFGNPSTSHANASTATGTSSDSEIDTHDERLPFDRISPGEVLWELVNLSDEELRLTMDDCQSKLENARRETDLVDRKSVALVKKNKKLMQQALSVALENNDDTTTSAAHL